MNYKGKRSFEIIYELNYDDWKMNVDIDFDFPDVMKIIKDSVEFWSGWEERLDWNDGDYVKTFLQQLGQKVFFMINECGSVYSLVKHFDWNDEFYGGEEGYYEMDGSKGIKITDVDVWSIYKDEFEINDVTKGDNNG